MRASLVLLLALSMTPLARAERVLHGRYQAELVAGAIETYRFHSDRTYERWVTGESWRLWTCGRYELRRGLLVLLEDRSEQSCSRHRFAPADAVRELWVPALHLRRDAPSFELAGTRYLRQAATGSSILTVSLRQ